LKDNRNCLIDILNLIDNLQKCSVVQNGSGCSKPFLGTQTASYNTRPVAFYMCDASRLAYTEGTTTYNVFRIENVNDTCVKIRLLTTNTDGTYSSTNETAIVNAKCICAIQCFGDVSITL